jgi:hypothetical protein
MSALWVLVEGGTRPFSITPSLTTSISDLKGVIKEMNSNGLQGVEALALVLWKVRYFQ